MSANFSGAPSVRVPVICSSSHASVARQLRNTRNATTNANSARSAADVYWNSTVVWCGPSAGRYGYTKMASYRK